MQLRTILVYAGTFSWVVWGAIWLLPQKLRLLKKYGYDKTNNDLRAHRDDPDVQKLVRDGRIFVAVGLIGGAILVLSKYL